MGPIHDKRQPMMRIYMRHRAGDDGGRAHRTGMGRFRPDDL